MITWIRTHITLTLTLLTVAAVAVGLGVLYAGADEARREAWEPEPEPPIPTIDPYPTAPMDLTPELDTTNDLENTDAVRTVRATYAAFRWASITDDTHFAQYQLYLGANDEAPFGWARMGVRLANIDLGPRAFVPMAITTAPDGTVTVDICTTLGDGSVQFDFFYDKAIVTADPDVGASAVSLSPITETERASLAAYDTSDLTLLMRTKEVSPVTDIDCTGVTAVQQVFTHWEEHLRK